MHMLSSIIYVCRLVMNKESQQAKGTAFIEYWDNGAASAAAAVCQKARYSPASPMHPQLFGLGCSRFRLSSMSQVAGQLCRGPTGTFGQTVQEDWSKKWF